MVKRSVALVCLLLLMWLMSCPLGAQPAVDVFWNPNNRGDTVMDFGVTLEGFPVRKTFYVVNHETEPVAILATNSLAEPYYLIVNTRDVPPEHPRKEEFYRIGGLPYHIPPGDTGEFEVEYGAFKNNPTFPPDVTAKALLELRVVLVRDSLGPAAFKRFLLQALKTRYAVASVVTEINFDSVYVNPAPQPPSQQYPVTNASTLTIPVVAQGLKFLTSVVGDPEFVVPTLPAPLLAPKDMLRWEVRYKPHNTGTDSAVFTIVYRPNPTSNTDSLQVRLSGTGVVQHLQVDNASGMPPPVTVRGDTIDFGDVNADGSGGKTARIVVRNTGNINIGYDGESLEGSPADVQAFTIQQKLMEGGSGIATNDTDTLQIVFNPVQGGVHEARYVVTSNLARRPIKGVPDGADRIVFVLRGFARKPRIDVVPGTVDFGAVVQQPACTPVSEQRLTISNTGNIILRIDSVTVEPFGAAVTCSPSTQIPAIAVGASQEFVLRYAPLQPELLEASLVVHSSAIGSPVRIPLAGSSVPADTLRVQVGSSSLRPGTLLQLPVVVDGNKIRMAQNSSLVLSFDPRQLRYRGSVTNKTASEGSQFLMDAEMPRGVVTIKQSANGSFKERDTFVVLLFDTYLGQNVSTELTLDAGTTKFGNAGCDNIFTVETHSGTFSTDSICGLQYKAGVGGTLRMAASPNPVFGTVQIAVQAAYDGPIKVYGYDVWGTQVFHTELAESAVISTSMESLPPGLYVFVATQGVRRNSVTVVRP